MGPSIEMVELLEEIVGIKGNVQLETDEDHIALANLYYTFEDQTEVFAEVVAGPIRSFASFVDYVTDSRIADVIKAHPSPTTRAKLMTYVIDTVQARSGKWPDSDVFSFDSEIYSNIAVNIGHLSRFFTANIEQKLDRFPDLQEQFIDWAYEIGKTYFLFDPNSDKGMYHFIGEVKGIITLNFTPESDIHVPSLDTLFEIVEKAPDILSGFHIAEQAARHSDYELGVKRLFRVMEEDNFRNIIRMISEIPEENAENYADVYRILTINSLNMPMTKTRMMLDIIVNSDWETANEVTLFALEYGSSGLYSKQLAVLNSDDSLAEKANRLAVFNAYKKKGIKVSQPSMDDEWRLDVLAESMMYTEVHDSGDVAALENAKTMDPDNTVDFFVYVYPFSDNGFLSDFATLRAAKAENWNVGKEYGTFHNNGSYHDQSWATELLVAGLIGRDPNKRAEAEDFFGNDLLLARGFVGEQNAGKIFADIREDFEKLKAGDLDAINRVREYFNVMIRVKGLDPEREKKRQALSYVLSDVTDTEVITSPIDYITTVMQSVVPSDLYDSRDLHCCTFRPYGWQDEGSINYLKQSSIGLLHYRLDDTDRNIGTGILIKQETPDGHLLIVDSSEGTPHLRYLPGWNPFVLQTFAHVASDIDAYGIFINDNVEGHTPISFVNYVRDSGLGKPVKMEIPFSTDLDSKGLESIMRTDQGFIGSKGIYIPRNKFSELVST